MREHTPLCWYTLAIMLIALLRQSKQGSAYQVATYIVDLYDILGHSIWHTSGVLSNDGMISTLFDLHDVASGVYFYRVESVGVVRSGRVAIQ